MNNFASAIACDAMLEPVVINLVLKDDDSLTGTASENENENEIYHTEICLAMK